MTVEAPLPVRAVMELADQHGEFPRFWELNYPLDSATILQFDGTYANKGRLSTRSNKWLWLRADDVQEENERNVRRRVHESNSNANHNTSVNPYFVCV